MISRDDLPRIQLEMLLPDAQSTADGKETDEAGDRPCALTNEATGADPEEKAPENREDDGIPWPAEEAFDGWETQRRPIFAASSSAFAGRSALPALRSKRNVPPWQNASGGGTFMKDDKKPGWKTMMGRTAICAGVFLLICLLKIVPVPFVQESLEGLHLAMTQDMDIDRTLGQLKFVQELLPESASVFFADNGRKQGEDVMAMAAPAEGRVSARFIAGQYDGIDIVSSLQTAVLCAYDGVVQEVGSNDAWGTYVRVRHNDRYDTVYANVREVSVKRGEDVTARQALAYPEKKGSEVVLHFVVLDNGKAVDPLPYLTGASSS